MPSNESPDKRSRRATPPSHSLGAALLALALAAGAPPATAAFARGDAAGTGGLSSPAMTQEDELHIELSPAGFDPAEVTHAAGAFAIAVDNEGVEGEYILQLKGEGGTLLKELRVQKGSVSWTVELDAGSYTLMVANRPEWLCRIVVQ